MDVFPGLPLKKIDAAYHEICSGDILLCANTEPHSKNSGLRASLILRTTANNIIVLRNEDNLAVRAVTLQSYVRNLTGIYPPRVIITRHAAIKTDNLITLQQMAQGLLENPCNAIELAHMATQLGIHSSLMKDAEFICADFMCLCFKFIAVDMALDSDGLISASALNAMQQLQPLFNLDTEARRVMMISKRLPVLSE